MLSFLVDDLLLDYCMTQPNEAIHWMHSGCRMRAQYVGVEWVQSESTVGAEGAQWMQRGCTVDAKWMQSGGRIVSLILTFRVNRDS